MWTTGERDLSGVPARYGRPVRWQRLFEDLEGELEAAEAVELEAEVAERSRIELAGVRLADRLAAWRGPVRLHLLGAGQLCGTVASVGDGWLLLDDPPVLVCSGALVSVQGVGLAAVGALPHEVSRRTSLAAALRRVARDRSPVRVALVDGRHLTGTVDAVAGDHLDLAEHAPDEHRRPGAVSRVHSLPFAALAAVTPGPTSLI